MEQITENTIDLSNFALPFEDLLSIFGQVEGIKMAPRAKNAGESLEQELHKVLEPLIYSGKRLHTEMLDMVMRDPTITLTEAEYVEISKVSDEKFVELALFAIAADLDMRIEDLDEYFHLSNSAWECFKEASGITDFMKIYATGTKNLLSATSVRQILRIMGVRFLGVAGMVYMSVMFTLCMTG